jgi:hypothetical protein
MIMRLDGSSYGEVYENKTGDRSSQLDDASLPFAYEMNLFMDEIEDLICSGVKVPLSSRVIIDEEQCLETLEAIRAAWPSEMAQAKRILLEEGEVLERAEVEAEEIRQRAEREAALILDQTQLAKMAEVRAQEVLEAAEQDAARLLRRAEQDARDVYQGLEHELDLLLRDVKELVAARLGRLRR